MNYAYAIDKTPRELLSQFYESYNLQDDGGYSDNKVKIELNKNIYFYLPNWDDRRKALLLHDIHHLITGYKSDFKGETEISSWEIGSGCQHYWAAWILDSYGMTWGFWFNLPGIFKAFVRGRHSKNLYMDFLPADKALDMTVAQIQQALQLPSPEEKINVKKTDVFWFVTALLTGGIFGVISIAALPFLILFNFYMFLTLRITNS